MTQSERRKKIMDLIVATLECNKICEELGITGSNVNIYGDCDYDTGESMGRAISKMMLHHQSDETAPNAEHVRWGTGSLMCWKKKPVDAWEKNALTPEVDW